MVARTVINACQPVQPMTRRLTFHKCIYLYLVVVDSRVLEKRDENFCMKRGQNLLQEGLPVLLNELTSRRCHND